MQTNNPPADGFAAACAPRACAPWASRVSEHASVPVTAVVRKSRRFMWRTPLEANGHVQPREPRLHDGGGPQPLAARTQAGRPRVVVGPVVRSRSIHVEDVIQIDADIHAALPEAYDLGEPHVQLGLTPSAYIRCVPAAPPVRDEPRSGSFPGAPRAT